MLTKDRFFCLLSLVTMLTSVILVNYHPIEYFLAYLAYTSMFLAYILEAEKKC